jgi:CubicO group peptidase (beta-lactamase class C family)
MKRMTSASILVCVGALGFSACASTSTPTATPTSERATTAEPATTAKPETITSASGAQPTDEQAIKKSRALFSKVTAEKPGCTVAVGRDGKVIWAEAFGASNLDPLTPLTASSVVDIGSTSKQFTATAIALLAQRGEVDVKAPLSTYVSGLPEWSKQVTVSQLIHHTSGILDYIGLLVGEGKTDTDRANDADALRVLATAPKLNFAPGDGWEYSNSNYFLMGQIVLKVTGEDVGKFVRTEMFTPTGMKAVMDATNIPEGKSKSYRLDAGKWVSADNFWTQLGDGGIQTTPTELVKWASQYWEPSVGGKDINTTRFTDSAVIADPSGALPAEAKYAYGIMETSIRGKRVLTHAGGWGGFVTTFVVVPEDKFVVTGTCVSPDSLPTTDRDTGEVLLDIWLP